MFEDPAISPWLKRIASHIWLCFCAFQTMWSSTSPIHSLFPGSLTRSPGVNHLSQTCHGLYDILNQFNGSAGLGVPSIVCVEDYFWTGEYGDQETKIEESAGDQSWRTQVRTREPGTMRDIVNRFSKHLSIHLVHTFLGDRSSVSYIGMPGQKGHHCYIDPFAWSWSGRGYIYICLAFFKKR